MTETALTTEELVKQARNDAKQLTTEQRAEVADEAVPGLQGKAREEWIATGKGGAEQTKDASAGNAVKRADARRKAAQENGQATDPKSLEPLIKKFVEAKGSTDANAPNEGLPFVEGGKLHVRAKWLTGFLGKDAPSDLKSALKALGAERVLVLGRGHYALPPAVTKRVAKGLGKREAGKAKAAPKNKAATPAKNKGGKASARKPRGKAVSQRKRAGKK